METTDILRRMTGILTLMAVTILLLIIALLVMNFTQNSDAKIISGNPISPQTEQKSVTKLTEAEHKGKDLFEANCKQCYAVTEEVVVGPGLKGISERRDEKWLTAWIKNSGKVLQSGDKYANELFEKYGKTPMTVFESMKDEEVKSILAYLKTAGQ